MSGFLDRWAANRMLIALHIETGAANKSDDEVAIEAFLWRHAGQQALSQTLEDARRERPELLEGVVVQDARPWLWIRIDGAYPDVHEVSASSHCVYDKDDVVEIVALADGHMVVVRNLTKDAEYRAVIDGLG